MDGFKIRVGDLRARIQGSLQFRMALVLSLAILVMALAAGVISFLSALHEAHKLQDNILYQIANLMQQQPLSEAKMLRLREHDDDSYILAWPLLPDRPKLRVHKDHMDALPLPNDLQDGMHTMVLGRETYRVLIRGNSAGRRIAIAQETHFRNRIAINSALRTVMPFLVLVPVLVLIVVLLVQNMFRPIARLAAEIDRRDEQDLDSIPDQYLLTEVRPFVRAINRLLARVAQSMQDQRRFVADAAHELRSPMTALSLQAERLADVDTPAPARQRLAELRHGIERVRNLLNQLLALARAQSSGTQKPAPVSVQQIYRRALEDLMPLAEARQIDIGLEGGRDVQIRVNELDVITLVRNLVDNAIRYTPENGRVDLAVTTAPGQVVLCIADTGPGIAPGERERVFDPFYRTPGTGQMGSGLGLAIVHTIAKRLDARIQLDYTDPAGQKGLKVSVVIPQA